MPLQPDDGLFTAQPPLHDEEAIERALRFIEYRPRSAGETRSRLRKWGYDPGAADAVVEYLEAAGIIDDSEFARLFMNELIRKEMGPYRIRSELKKKMLDREMVDEMLSEYTFEDEVGRAEQAARRRYRQIGGKSVADTRLKLIGYLVRRGYSRQAAETAWRSMLQVDTESDAELE